MPSDFDIAGDAPPQGYLRIAESPRTIPFVDQFDRPGPNPSRPSALPGMQNRVAGGAIYLATMRNVPGLDVVENNSDTVYYTPTDIVPPGWEERFASRNSPLLNPGTYVWDQRSGAWSRMGFTELSLTLSTLNASTPYDIFYYPGALVAIAWGSATARVASIRYVRGRLCCPHPTKGTPVLYLGSIYVDANKLVHDNAANRCIYDHYRVGRGGYIRESVCDVLADITESWTSSVTSTYETMHQEANVIGSEDLRWTYNVMMGMPTPLQFQASVRADANASIGISVDAATAASIDSAFSTTATSSGTVQSITATAQTTVFGFHTFRAMQSKSSGTPNFYGNDEASIRRLAFSSPGISGGGVDVRALGRQYASFVILR